MKNGDFPVRYLSLPEGKYDVPFPQMHHDSKVQQ